MASTAGASVNSPAPWKATFLDHVMNNMDSPEFVLSTLHSAPADSPTPFVPKARFCIFRGMWAELPENKHNNAPKNERVFESEMPTLTTDVRMEKVPEVFASSHGHADRLELVQGSGGGGPVEAVWWVKSIKVQWRIKGHAFVIAPDIEGEGEESSGVRTVKSELSKRLLVVKPGKEKEWSWSTELTGHFGNVSPAMRGTFKQPPPGRPVSEPYNDNEEVMGESVQSLGDAICRKHFRVMVIRPDEVESVDLSDPSVARRSKYTFNSATGGWDKVITWP